MTDPIVQHTIDTITEVLSGDGIYVSARQSYRIGPLDVKRYMDAYGLDRGKAIAEVAKFAAYAINCIPSTALPETSHH